MATTTSLIGLADERHATATQTGSDDLASASPRQDSQKWIWMPTMSKVCVGDPTHHKCVASYAALNDP
eukprot:scaffold326471_cov64-Tisochrysis_lutea.AAC.1